MLRLSLLALTLTFSFPALAEDFDCPTRFVEVQHGQEQLQSELAKKDEELGQAVVGEFKQDYYNYAFTDATPEKAAAWNAKFLEKMKEIPMTGAERGRKAGLTPEEIQAIYDKGENNPVAAYHHVKKYDPEGNIGFCFGRAMNMHLEAIRQGVSKDAIRKIWAVGTMQYDNIKWSHHVATMVRGKNGRWYVLDPEYDRPLLLERWYATVKKMDTNGKLTFFASDPKRWGPEYGKLKRDFAYTPGGLQGYNNYFQDLMKVSREEAQDVIRQRHAAVEAGEKAADRASAASAAAKGEDQAADKALAAPANDNAGD